MSTQLVESEWIWKDGVFIKWHEATVHILSLAVQFGSSIFEGIRCYRTPKGPAVFRLGDHLRRLRDSCHIYRIDLPHSQEELIAGSRAVIAKNDLEECYLRPMVLRGYGAAGMNPVGSPIETYLVCWPWGTYLGEDALEQGVDVCVSSWHRPAPNTYPANAKAAGHYTNPQLMKMEAIADGYTEAIALGPGGVVSEGSGQNLFVVRDGGLHTPATDGTLLRGITRHSVITVANELGIPVWEEAIPRETLYTADEMFFTGTASEITPIRSVDRITVGAGRAGPLTRRLQQHFMAVVHGEVEDQHRWLTLVR